MSSTSHSRSLFRHVRRGDIGGAASAGPRAGGASHPERHRPGREIRKREVVELRNVGRKTGQTRVTVLTSPLHDEDPVVLVASKYGNDRNPQW